jgi:hypothetical protein
MSAQTDLSSIAVSSGYVQLLHTGDTSGIEADATAHYITDGNGTASALSISTTRVGIGIAAPESLLHISFSDTDTDVVSTESLKIENSSESGSSYAGILFSTRPNNPGKAFMGFQRSGSYGVGDFAFFLDAVGDDNGVSNADEVMRITSAGNVGIGTASPVSALEVKGGDLTITNGNILLSDASPVITFDNGYVKIERASDALKFTSYSGWQFYDSQGSAERFKITNAGNVGIGTAAPANPLAVNRSGDGVIVDFESADAVEGTVSISGATTSYNAFVGSHYTQLKDGQSDLPVGSVVSSTGEIITCNLVTEAIAGVDSVEAKDAVYETVTKQRQKVVVTEIEEEQTGTEIVEEGGKYVQKTTTETVTKEVSTPQYEEVKLYDEDGEEIGTHQIQVMEDYEEEQLVSEAVEAVEAIEAIEAVTTNSPNKEYFTYINTTTTASDSTVYGTWMGKMSDDAKGHSFGDDDKPIYLVAQVGLFKIRVTDTNGNIAKGDYLESSTRAMEGQKQTSNSRVNSTIGKAMIDVDWASIETDSDLSYKWKLIPCTF